MRKLSHILFLVILFVGITGCGDNSSGIDTKKDEPPAIPDLAEQVQPDISYFDADPMNKKAKSITSEMEESSKIRADYYDEVYGEYSHYYMAQLAITSLSFISRLGTTYFGIFQEIGDDPDYNDGNWTWSFGHSEFTVDFTSKEVGSSIQWTMDYSADMEDLQLDNYRVMEGTTSKDGVSGTWTFNQLRVESGSETPFIVTEWDNESATERDITTDIYDDGSIGSTLHYIQNGTEHMMTLKEAGSSEDYEVFWNTDAMEGYFIDENGEKSCWNADFKNIPCG